jgi:hypothetical protein
MHGKDYEWLELFDHPIGSKRVNPGTSAHWDQQDIDRSDGSRLRLRKNMTRVTEVRDTALASESEHGTWSSWHVSTV